MKKVRLKLRILIGLSNIVTLLLLNCLVANGQNFSSFQNNPFSLTWSSNYSIPAFADLDGDGDLDMMSGSVSHGFYYYENIGTKNSPSFAAFQENPFSLTWSSNYSTPAFVDLDGDGDIDMMSGSVSHGFYYYENVGTKNSPSFTAFQNNPFSLTRSSNYSTPAFVDLDGDGDIDMMSGSVSQGFYYYKNVGTKNSPSFAAFQNNPFSLTWSSNNSNQTFADLDGDGDMDMTSGSVSHGFYYYNNTQLSYGTLEKLRDEMTVLVYPNPSSGKFVVKINNSSIKAIEINNMLGEIICLMSVTKMIDQQIDLSTKPKGIYFLKFYDGEKTYVSKIVIK